MNMLAADTQQRPYFDAMHARLREANNKRNICLHPLWNIRTSGTTGEDCGEAGRSRHFTANTDFSSETG